MLARPDPDPPLPLSSLSLHLFGTLWHIAGTLVLYTKGEQGQKGCMCIDNKSTNWGQSTDSEHRHKLKVNINENPIGATTEISDFAESVP